MKRQIVFHPVLFAAAPVLALYIVNTEQIYWQEIVGTLLIVFGLVGGMWFALYRALKNLNKAAWLASLCVVTFFSYSRVWPATNGGAILKFVVWLGVMTGAGVWTIRSRRDFKLTTGFLNIVSIGWVITILAPWLYYITVVMRDNQARVNQYIADWSVQAWTDFPACTAKNTPSARPDIYYIILDGYGRTDILQQLYNFDNTSFTTFLRDQGFYVAERSTSNYAQTALSLSSSLNFEYLDDLVARLGADTRTIMPLRAMLAANRLTNALRSFGYQTIAFSSGYPPTEMINADHYMAPSFQLSAFQQELINTTPLPLVLTAVPGLSQYDVHRDRILFALERLPAIARLPEPTFTFVHLLAPHPPFVFGPSGASVQANSFQPFALSDGSLFTGGSEQYVAAYRDQISFMTAKIQQVITGLLTQSSEPPIIIVQGDHGPGSRLNWQNPADSYLPERFSILNAYYFPDRDYTALYSEITPVNTFRIVLNQFFCGQYPRLPDDNYFSPIGQSYALTDVTQAVREQR